MRGTFLALCFLAACGTNGVPAPDDLGGQAGADLTGAPPADLLQPVDLTSGHTLMCGNMVCTGTKHCCVTQSAGMSVPGCTTSCPDGGLSIECGGTEDCGGNPCCLKLAGGAAQSTTCESAPSGCDPMFTLAGGGASGQTRLCHTSTDCTAGDAQTQYPDCCVAMMQGASQKICFNKQLVGLTSGAITCP
jgi:hypothetical protein